MVVRTKRENYRFGRNEICFGCVVSRPAASSKRLPAFYHGAEQVTHGLNGRWRRGLKIAELVPSKHRAIGAGNCIADDPIFVIAAACEHLDKYGVAQQPSHTARFQVLAPWKASLAA